jgi:hypothetical protein
MERGPLAVVVCFAISNLDDKELTLTSPSKEDPLAMLILVAERTREFRFPNLRRPPIPPNKPPTRELINWAGQVYCFSLLRHLSSVANGITILSEAGNVPSARIVARSAFELGAHAYYVKKHLKQHIDADDLVAAWHFLAPIGTGSRYINEQHSEESDLFPTSAHISKAIKCLDEVMPDARGNYSFLSEFCHPNMLAFSQHYDWLNPFEVTFADHGAPRSFGAATAACIIGLMAILEMLQLTSERAVSLYLRKLLEAIAENRRGNANSRTEKR